MRSLTILEGCFLLIGVAGGCSPARVEERPVTHKVTGKVIYKGGKAYSKSGAIEFRHETQSGATSIGEIQSDGSFELRTVTAHHRLVGALEGAHFVTIIPVSPNQDIQPILLAKKYAVAPGDNQLIVEIEDRKAVPFSR
jgi:hypothetical protein